MYHPRMETRPTDKQPRKTTVRGFTRWMYLTHDQIEAILDEVRAGVPIEEACRTAGTSSSQFSRRCKREPDLAEQVKEAMEEGLPAKQNWLRYMIHQQIKNGNWKALRDEAMIHLPEYEALRTQRFEHTVTHQDALTTAIVKAVEKMSNAELDSEIAKLEALPPDEHPVLELPARSTAA